MGTGKKRSGQDVQTLRWKPQMKNAAKRSRSLSSSGTAGMADAALTGMCTINKLRAQGREVDEPYMAKLAGQARPAADTAAAKPTRIRPGATAPSPARRRVLFAVAAIACGVGAAAFVVGSGVLTGRYTIAGKVWLERRPLGTAELQFHPADPGTDPTTVVAANDGKFELKDVAPGRYRVTVHPPAGSTVAANYTKPESTPFQVNINRDVNSLQLYAYKVLPKPRKQTWQPGVD